MFKNKGFGSTIWVLYCCCCVVVLFDATRREEVFLRERKVVLRTRESQPIFKIICKYIIYIYVQEGNGNDV